MISEKDGLCRGSLLKKGTLVKEIASFLFLKMRLEFF
jgi:hypothetical protein